jgi:FixJ family two-component response regulator
MLEIRDGGRRTAEPWRQWERMIEKRPCEVAVVDDDPAVLESFRFILELNGYQVATYPSAMAYLNNTKTPPHCLILDQHMPMMTGLELVKALRLNGSDIPVLLITAAPSPAIAARANEAGVVQVLEKPPAEEEVIRFVSGCC